MDEINPSYYAEGGVILRFELIGRGFHNVPNEAIAIAAIDNDNPLELLNNTSAWNIMSIVEREENSLKFESTIETTNVQHYLGAIVSPDRQTIYWVNNSKPLP